MARTSDAGMTRTKKTVYAWTKCKWPTGEGSPIAGAAERILKTRNVLVLLFSRAWTSMQHDLKEWSSYSIGGFTDATVFRGAL